MNLFIDPEQNAGMIIRDRLIVSAAAFPAVFGFGLAIAISRDLIIAGAVAVVASLISAGITLTPSVRAARIRIMRRKYPDAS
ncbi:hypothetical protein [Brevundimonas sp.]|uniref:hypothetical protein n=1 Tax=Brevundimonas sp. TaxID=1871086 RepID=UPI00356855B0